MDKLSLWDTKQINKAYWDKLHSKEPWIKSKKSIKKKKPLDVHKTMKFNKFCKKQWYVDSDWKWDYNKLVKWRKNLNMKDIYKLFKWRKNLNMKDIYKLFNDNEKLLQKYVALNNKRNLNYSEKNNLKLMQSQIINY